MDYVAYVRVFIRKKRNIKRATADLGVLLKDVEFALDGLYDISVTIADNV